MSRIEDKLFELRANKKKALVAFITAGDPTLAETEKYILLLEKSGVDVIELGMPFSDPMADGPVIQASSERALAKGVSVEAILDLVERVRRKTQIPILLMGYINPIFVMGYKKFAQKAAKAGVDGLLIVDLPPEESGELKGYLDNQDVNLIYLLAPTSNESRIQKAAKVGSGFIYYVSMTGVTGAKLTATDEIKDQVFKIRQWSDLPVMVGFGISKPEQARLISQKADGVVIGSALVALIHKNRQNKNRYQVVSRYLQSIKKAI